MVKEINPQTKNERNKMTSLQLVEDHITRNLIEELKELKTKTYTNIRNANRIINNVNENDINVVYNIVKENKFYKETSSITISWKGL